MRPLWLQTPQQLADHLRSFRRSRNLTQAGLGRLVGLDQTRIAKIERDPRVVSLGQLMKLLAVLEVRILLEPAEQERRQDYVAEDRAEWKVGARAKGRSAGTSGSRGKRGAKRQPGAAEKAGSTLRDENSDDPVEW